MLGLPAPGREAHRVGETGGLPCAAEHQTLVLHRRKGARGRNACRRTSADARRSDDEPSGWLRVASKPGGVAPWGTTQRGCPACPTRSRMLINAQSHVRQASVSRRLTARLARSAKAAPQGRNLQSCDVSVRALPRKNGAKRGGSGHRRPRARRLARRASRRLVCRCRQSSRRPLSRRGRSRRNGCATPVPAPPAAPSRSAHGSRPTPPALRPIHIHRAGAPVPAI